MNSLPLCGAVPTRAGAHLPASANQSGDVGCSNMSLHDSDSLLLLFSQNEEILRLVDPSNAFERLAR